MAYDVGIAERIAEYFDRTDRPLRAQRIRGGEIHDIDIDDVIVLVREALEEE